jgi:hypothetical protein
MDNSTRMIGRVQMGLFCVLARRHALRGWRRGLGAGLCATIVPWATAGV